MILCHSERSEESMKRTEQRVHRIDKFILFCCSVFKQLLDILLVVFVYCSFGAQKNEKARHTGKIVSSTLLFVPRSEHSAGYLIATSGFRLFSGCCGTRSARLYKENYTLALLRHPRTMARKQTTLRWIFNGAGGFGVTFVRDNAHQ